MNKLRLKRKLSLIPKVAKVFAFCVMQARDAGMPSSAARICVSPIAYFAIRPQTVWTGRTSCELPTVQVSPTFFNLG